MSWLSDVTGIDINVGKALEEGAKHIEETVQSAWNDYTGITETRLANEANAREAALARDWSANEADIARKFEERMSNSSYQRGVADMEKAGINPMLAYMKGGASTPSVGIPGVTAARMEAAPKSAALQSMVNSAISYARFKKEMKLLEKQVPIMDAQGKKAESDAEVVKQMNKAKLKVLDVVNQTPENVISIFGGIKNILGTWFGGSTKTNYMKSREVEEKIKSIFKKKEK